MYYSPSESELREQPVSVKDRLVLRQIIDQIHMPRSLMLRTQAKLRLKERTVTSVAEDAPKVIKA